MTVLRNVALAAGRRSMAGSAAVPVALEATVSTRPLPQLDVPRHEERAEADLASHATASQATADSGYEDGLARGLSDAAARIEQQIELRARGLQAQAEQSERRRAEEHAQQLRSLDALLLGLQEGLPLRWAELERQAIELAYTALCRAVGPEHDRGALLAGLVQQGVRELRGHVLLSVRMHPADLKLLAGSKAGIASSIGRQDVQWIPDPTLERAGCVVVSDHGQIDASLGTQLDRLRELWSQAGKDTAGMAASGASS